MLWPPAGCESLLKIVLTILHGHIVILAFAIRVPILATGYGHIVRTRTADETEWQAFETQWLRESTTIQQIEGKLEGQPWIMA